MTRQLFQHVLFLCGVLVLAFSAFASESEGTTIGELTWGPCVKGTISDPVVPLCDKDCVVYCDDKCADYIVNKGGCQNLNAKFCSNFNATVDKQLCRLCECTWPFGGCVNIAGKVYPSGTQGIPSCSS